MPWWHISRYHLVNVLRLFGLIMHFFFTCLLFPMIQEPSVALAVQLLDGTPFRPGGKTHMSVSPAKFEQKGIVSWCQNQIHQLQNLSAVTDAIAYVHVLGDVFVSKKTDKQKKRKIKKVEDKMLRWGNLDCCFLTVALNYTVDSRIGSYFICFLDNFL